VIGTAVQESSNIKRTARRQLWIDVGLVLWTSFLSASAASVLCFAAVDPQLLRDAGPRIFDNLNREAGYALGFFFFWAIGVVASGLSVFMVRSARPQSRALHDGESP
jgi:hypothetical protein